MPIFGKRSLSHLETTHPKLQELFNEVIKTYNCVILCGHRNESEQDKAFHEGRSKLRYPLSKHNINPSFAVDVVPYPVDWNDHNRFYFFAGYVLATAHRLGTKIRWGGDWDGDFDLKDNNFFDLPHFELVE